MTALESPRVSANGYGLYRAQLLTTGNARTDQARARRAIVAALAEREQTTGETLASARARVSSSLRVTLLTPADSSGRAHYGEQA